MYEIVDKVAQYDRRLSKALYKRFLHLVRDDVSWLRTAVEATGKYSKPQPRMRNAEWLINEALDWLVEKAGPTIRTQGTDCFGYTVTVKTCGAPIADADPIFDADRRLALNWIKSRDGIERFCADRCIKQPNFQSAFGTIGARHRSTADAADHRRGPWRNPQRPSSHWRRSDCNRDAPWSSRNLALERRRKAPGRIGRRQARIDPRFAAPPSPLWRDETRGLIDVHLPSAVHPLAASHSPHERIADGCALTTDLHHSRSHRSDRHLGRQHPPRDEKGSYVEVPERPARFLRGDVESWFQIGDAAKRAPAKSFTSVRITEDARELPATMLPTSRRAA